MRALPLVLLILSGSGCAATPTETQPDSGGLVYEGKPLDYWLKEVKDLSGERQKAAREALRAFKEEALPPLVAMLRDPSLRLRRIAARTLSECYHDAAPVASALVEASKDADEEVRGSAISALRNMLVVGGKADEALPALEDAAANDPDKGLREFAAKSVAEVREAQRKAAERAKDSP
jgi:HEAT repeat protein